MRTEFRNKSIVYGGADPGATGCLCLIDKDNKLIFVDWPKDNNYTDIYRKVKILKLKYKIKLIILEKVSSHPGQGVKSVWSFSGNYHAWQMLFTCLNIPFILITPQSWQKGLLTRTDGNDPKARVKNVVTRMFDEKYFFGIRGGYKSDRGDAALMAYKARLIDKGNVL